MTIEELAGARSESGLESPAIGGPPQRTVCIYHGDCPDGVTAAFLVQAWHADKGFGTLEFIAGKYAVAPDLEFLAGAYVVLVDFSYKRPVMELILKSCVMLLVLDHHQTAEAELAGFGENNPCVTVKFDQNRSGAGMAWDYFFDSPRPLLVDHVEDRDLWRFSLPHTRDIHFYCGMFPMTVQARGEIFASLSTPEGYFAAVEKGKAIATYHDELVKQAAKYRPRRRIGGHDVPCVSVTIPALISDVGHSLADGEAFAATYTETDDGTTIVSLRSTDEGLDVSEIAKGYGGGGHKHAAGFHLIPGMGFGGIK